MIYAIHGKKRVGKDTVAMMIHNATGALPYALAYPIHESLAYAFDKIEYNITYKMVSGQTPFDRERGFFSDSEVKRILHHALDWNHRKRPFPKLEIARAHSIVDQIELRDDELWSVRRLMQALGTDIVVRVRPYYWLDAVEPLAINNDIVVIDVRQQHELDFFRSRDAAIMFVYRQTNLSDNHVTEQGLEPIPTDFIIHNDLGVGPLRSRVNEIIQLNQSLRK